MFDMEEVLTVNKISKKYDGKQIACEDVSFSVCRGEIFGMVGSNGAGKTTIMKIITTLIKPDSGNVLICGLDNKTERNQALRHVALVSAEPEYYSYLSGYENMAIYQRIFGNFNRTEILSAAETVGLKDRIFDKTKKYSTGMIKRLMLGEALLQKPDIILLDEPFNGLDPESTLQLRNFILDARNNHNISFVISSHRLSEISKLCDRVLFVKKGRVVETKSNIGSDVDFEKEYFDIMKE